MIALIRGEVEEINLDHIILECQGIGYQVFMNNRDLGDIEISQKIKVYTQMMVREDDVSLYGFIQLFDRTIFNRLRSVGGIGAKTALAILSMLSAKEIVQLIIEENHTFLTQVPGIGKKTSARIIIELRDSFMKEYGDTISLSPLETKKSSPHVEEVKDALMQLGYERSEVHSVLKELDTSDSVEEMLKQALKLLVRW